MANGISLHLGLNAVDPRHYADWPGHLRSAENDARAMSSIARFRGFTPTTLLTQEATSARVMQYMAQAAGLLRAGDIFLITFAGHGAQIPDVNGDEEDGVDETWLLYDRMLVDDELYGMWSEFAEGVRIVMVSDSCHSGTMARNAFYTQLVDHPTLSSRYSASTPPSFRVASADIAMRTYEANRTFYNSVQWSAVHGDQIDIQASAILIAACQDNQTAAEGRENGLFTAALLDAWHGGTYAGSYYGFYREIALRMPPIQTPNFYTVGKPLLEFQSQRPFEVNSSISGTKGDVTMSTWNESKSANINVDADETDQSRTKCVFEFSVDQKILSDMTNDEVYELLRTDGCNAMMDAFVAAKAASKEVSTPDDTARKWKPKSTKVAIEASGDSKSGGSGGAKVTLTLEW